MIAQNSSSGKPETVSLNDTQTIALLGGEQYVVMGRVCKAMQVKASNGMEMARKHADSLLRAKPQVIDASTGRKGSFTVMIPLTRFLTWLSLVDPRYVDSPDIRRDLERFQDRKVWDSSPAVPYSVARLLVDENGKKVEPLASVDQTSSSREVETQTTAKKEPLQLVTPKAQRASKPAIVRKAERLASIQGRIGSLKSQMAELEVEAGKVKRDIIKLAGGEEQSGTATVADFCAQRRINIDSEKASAIGRVASGYCRIRNIETGTAPHPLYKSVKTYPVEALEYAVAQQGAPQ